MTSGLKERLYYKSDSYGGTVSFNFVTDYLREGIGTNNELYFSQVNVPTKRFSEGFATQDNALIKRDNGEVLVEYFSLHLESTLKLKSDETAGNYQMAIFSDDGSILSVSGAEGRPGLRINNDQLHSAKLSCSNQLLNMNSKTRLPITIDYFQGPREHIALIVLWRKVPDGAVASDEPPVA